MLDQVGVAGAVSLGVGLQGEHGVPLVVAGEDHGFLLDLAPFLGALLLNLQVNES